MSVSHRGLFATLTLCLAGATGCAAESTHEELFLRALDQELVQSTNGLRTINGLSSINGLRSINGLTTINGLRTINGLTTMNGLRTLNGLPTVNGLSVDCTGKVLGETCTGIADGLLSAATGLLKNAEGVMTAKYLTRCALPAGDGFTLKAFDASLTVFPGELGLAPGWKDGQCDSVCEERISACMMAFTNGEGNHVAIEMSQNNSSIGAGHSYPYQEAAFFGNVFSSPPKAYYCVGADFTGLLGTNIGSPEQRACSGYSLLGASCPYTKAGNCNGALLSPGACSFSNSAATSCKTSTGLLSSGTTWKYPITTYRQNKN